MTIRKIVGGLLVTVCAGFVYTHQQPVIGAAKTVYHDVQKDMSSLTSVAMSGRRRVKTTDLTETVRHAPRATTNNAPPLDPVTIDGVYLRYKPVQAIRWTLSDPHRARSCVDRCESVTRTCLSVQRQPSAVYDDHLFWHWTATRPQFSAGRGSHPVGTRRLVLRTAVQDGRKVLGLLARARCLSVPQCAV